MSFKALDQKLLEVLPDHPKNGEKVEDSFRWAYLHILREVNGNLDTLALCARAHIEVFDSIKLQNQALLTALDQIAGHLEKIANPQVSLDDSALTGRIAFNLERIANALEKHAALLPELEEVGAPPAKPGKKAK